jgi:hypothetical protein
MISTRVIRFAAILAVIAVEASEKPRIVTSVAAAASGGPGSIVRRSSKKLDDDVVQRDMEDALLKYLPCEKYSAQFSAANATMKRELVSSQGWNLMEDRKEKPGWISDQIGSRITFPLVFGSKPTIGIGFLRSYEKMGQASIKIIEPDGKSLPLGEIDGLWENTEASKFSVPDIKWYYPRVEPNMNMSVVVEIIHPAEPRESHKMKIVNVVSC